MNCTDEVCGYGSFEPRLMPSACGNSYVRPKKAVGLLRSARFVRKLKNFAAASCRGLLTTVG
jgi:hypothetical protein